jgi:hypothetical protein
MDISREAGRPAEILISDMFSASAYRAMQQSPSCEAESYLVTKFDNFYGTRRFTTLLKEVVINPYPEPDESSPHTYTISPQETF